ncbi:MAG TPA: SCO family protein [Candidatus Binataceae bacterium]|nr:SCO family protein [Candidatus Binataceae bacterium]
MKKYLMMKINLRTAIAVTLALAVVALGGAWALLLFERPVATAARSGTAAIGGPFSLAATNGQTVTDQTYRGKWQFIFFGYTFCPDACPTALNNISIALEKLGTDANKLQPLFITVDPHRDTQKVMTDYLKSFDSRVIGLTGTQEQIDRVVKEYRVYVSRDKSDDQKADDYLVSHSAYIYLMDPAGKFVDVIQGNESGEAIAEWLHKRMARASGGA